MKLMENWFVIYDKLDSPEVINLQLFPGHLVIMKSVDK